MEFITLSLGLGLINRLKYIIIQWKNGLKLWTFLQNSIENEVNIFYTIHERTKFSGFCSNCQKDLCIHCLKEHSGIHHCLVKYLELIPSKEKINAYKNQIKNEIEYIDLVKNILLGNEKEDKINYFINRIKKYNEVLLFCKNRIKNVNEIKLITWIC